MKFAFFIITIFLFFVVARFIIPNIFPRVVLADTYGGPCTSCNGASAPGGSSCFPAGTKATMGNLTKKNIEDVKAGDKVISQNEEGIKSVSTVTSVERPIRDNMCQIKFTDGETLSLTKEHPLFTSLGWKAINPEDTAKEAPGLAVGQLIPGDKVAKEDKSWATVSFLSCQPGTFQTYNLLLADGAHSYFADGFLAHNKYWTCSAQDCGGTGGGTWEWTCFPAGTKVLMSSGEQKNIEDVKVGDRVKSQSETGNKSVSTVTSLDQPIRDHMCQINFADGDKLKLTDEHPLLSKNGWKAIIPKKEAYADPNLVVTPLDYGDRLIKSDGSTAAVKSFACWSETIQTYNLILDGSAHTYFADNYLAHNKGNGVCDPNVSNVSCTSCGTGVHQQGRVTGTSVTPINSTQAIISWTTDNPYFNNSNLNCSAKTIGSGDTILDFGSWVIFISTDKTLVENNCDNEGQPRSKYHYGPVEQIPDCQNGINCPDKGYQLVPGLSLKPPRLPGDCISIDVGEKGKWFNMQTGLDSTYDGKCSGVTCQSGATPDGKHKPISLQPNQVYYIKVASNLFYPNTCQYGGAWCGAGPATPFVGQCTVSPVPPSTSTLTVGDTATFKTTFSGATEPVTPDLFNPYTRESGNVTYDCGGANSKTCLDYVWINGWYFGNGGFDEVHFPGSDRPILVEPVIPGGDMFSNSIHISPDDAAIENIDKPPDHRLMPPSNNQSLVTFIDANDLAPQWPSFGTSAHCVRFSDPCQVDMFYIDGYFFGNGGYIKLKIKGSDGAWHSLIEPVSGTPNDGRIAVPPGDLTHIGIPVGTGINGQNTLTNWCSNHGGCTLSYITDTSLAEHSNLYTSHPYVQTRDSQVDNVKYTGVATYLNPPTFPKVVSNPPYTVQVTAKAPTSSTTLKSFTYAADVLNPPAASCSANIIIPAIPSCDVTLPSTTSVGVDKNKTVNATVALHNGAAINSVSFSAGPSVSLSPQPHTGNVYPVRVTGVTANPTTLNVNVVLNSSGTPCHTSSAITVTQGTPINAWWQVIDSDVASDGDLTSAVPATKFFGLNGLGGYPGVPAFGGSTNLTNTNVSENTNAKWLAKSQESGKIFNYASFYSQIPADTLANKIHPFDQTTIGEADLAVGGQADSNGYYWYKFDGTASTHNGADLTLNTTDFTNHPARKVILLVANANLIINGNINLTNGHGFFMAIVGKDPNPHRIDPTGNITVNPAVGDSGPNLEGLFVADGSFDDSSGTKQLYVRGSVAAYDGVNLQRDFQDDTKNGANPAEKFEYAPDQIMLFPSPLGARSINWKEVAP